MVDPSEETSVSLGRRGLSPWLLLGEGLDMNQVRNPNTF